MGAPKGNRFWEVRAKSGRDKIFSNADVMWKAACEYFEWVEDNPLWENKPTQYQGDVIDIPTDKMRAMTDAGLCLFWGVNTKYLYQFELGLDKTTESGKDFSNIIGQIKDVIRSQKFAGAAAGILNANIIARDLGLKEKSEQEVVIVDDELSDEERAERLAKLYDKARARRTEQSSE